MIKIDRKFIKGAIQLADPKIWVMSYIPATIGLALAIVYGKAAVELPDIVWILLMYIALGFIETGKNALNEYVDFRSGVDPGVDEDHVTPFSGGKKTVTSGKLDLGQVVFITVATFLGAGAIGLTIVIFKEPRILYIGIAGIVISILYSMPPFKLCYRGWGELAVGVTFGPLVLSGAYVLLTGGLDVLPALISIPLGLLIANILLINEFPDYEADKKGDKRNLVVRAGKKNSAAIFGAVFVLIYLSFIGISVFASNPVWLLPLLTAPIALKAYRNSVENHENISLLILSNAKTIQIFFLTGLLLLIGILSLLLF
ncbi:MAG: prenyltransferase [Saccharofermentanales bacterium]